MDGVSVLRFVTYLVPSLPREFYAGLAEFVGRRLELETALEVDSTRSGPIGDPRNPFSTGAAEVGFMCCPSYLWLRHRDPQAVDLLPVAPVHADPRSQGRPVYFSEVVVRRDAELRSFADLRGRAWAYNDASSLSGFYNVLKQLHHLGTDARYFGSIRASGSHHASLDLIAEGEVDGAAIDSNALRLRLEREPALRERVRVLESWGPYPSQPVVLRSGLSPRLKQALAEALLEAAAELGELFRRSHVHGFAPVDEAHYDSERDLLERIRPLEADFRDGAVGPAD